MKSRFAVVCSARFSMASRYGHRFAAAVRATRGRKQHNSRPRVALPAAANRLFVRHFWKRDALADAKVASKVGCLKSQKNLRFLLNNKVRRNSGAKHCSSLCSQSEGGEYCGGPARAENPSKSCPRALVMFATCSWPSLCEQSELQCFALGLRCMFAQCPLQRCRNRHAIWPEITQRIFFDFAPPT